VKVVIVNPETKGPVGDSHLGEIWVNSPHTASGYYTIYDSETLQADHFNTRLSFGDAAQTLWARTGYLGFVRRTELTAATGGSFLSSAFPSACFVLQPVALARLPQPAFALSHVCVFSHPLL